MHSGWPIFTFTFNHMRALMHFLRNRIISSQAMIVDILLHCVWYVPSESRLIGGETVEMGGSVGFVG
jgi:hypothetical protein